MRPLINQPTVYDPRLNQRREFEISPNKLVSNLTERFWLMETANGVFEEHQQLLSTVFGSVEGKGFATYVPWGPNRAHQRSVFAELFREIFAFSDALFLGYDFTPAAEVVPNVLRIRASLGGSASGVWSLGVANSCDDLRSSILAAGLSADSPTFAIANSMHTVNCALSLDDGVDMLFLRLTSQTEPLADRLKTVIFPQTEQE